MKIVFTKSSVSFLMFFKGSLLKKLRKTFVLHGRFILLFLIHPFPSIAYDISNFDCGFQTPLLHYKKETNQ